MANGQWTASQMRAAPFAWSAASRGLSQIAGETQFRAGGGRIRHAAWREVFQAAFAIVGWRETIASIPKDWKIPARMFTPVGYDYTSKFNLRTEVRWFDPSVGQWRIQSIQVGSEELLTVRDWEAQVEEWLSDYGARGQYDPAKGFRIQEYEAMATM